MSAVDSWYLGRQAQVMAASGLRRALLRSDARRVRHFEATYYRRFDRVVVVSEEDKRVLASLDPSLHIGLIPNGVDSEFFRPKETGLVQTSRIIFHGSMHYAPNVVAAEFLAREIMPKVRAAVPAAHLVIVGRSPGSRVRALNNLSDVHVTGSVPDIRPWLLGSRVYACPMKSGSGIKNKLLEAMACGLPCVATPLSLGGMTARPDGEVLIGRNADEFAAKLVRVLSEDALAHALGTAAREYVRAHHTWEAAARAYVKLYRDALTDRERRTPSIGPSQQGGGSQES
jgi:glycosyltransferase involved in cell wall biosynthesis